MGRPPGSKNRAAQFLHYNPKRWQPEFDLIVMKSIAGADNEEIGREFGYTPQHVSNILSTQQAKDLKEKIRSTIETEFDSNLKTRIAGIGAKTLKHIEDFVARDDLADKSPFQFIDRVTKIAQSVGAIGSDTKSSVNNNTFVQGNALIINGEQADRIKDGLFKSTELDNIKIGDPVKVVDVESPNKLRAG